MTASLVLPVLAASLVGSLHCAGMCGAFSAFYAGAGAGPRRFLPHAAYNFGRLLTYLALGAAAGMLGGVVDLAGNAAGIGRVAGAFAGALMLVWGLSILMEHAGLTWLRLRVPGRIERALRGALSRLRARPPALRAALLGLSSTLLPCGWLYAFAVTAAGTGSAAGGMMVMGAFWLGTVPMLLGLGLGVQRLSQHLRRHVPVLTGVALLAVGLAGVLNRINLPAHAIDAMRAERPCCHHRP